MTVYQYVDEITGQQQDLEPTDPLDPVPTGLTLLVNEDTSPYQTIPLDSYQYWDFTNKAWYYPLFSLLTLVDIQRETDDTTTTFSWNGNDYSVGSFQAFPWTEIFQEAIRENKADERAVIFPDGSTATLTNAQIVDLFETFSNFIQATRDIYTGVLAGINNTTITTLVEINSYWISARSGYVNTRTVATDNEDLQNNKVDKVTGKGLSTSDVAIYLGHTLKTLAKGIFKTATVSSGVAIFYLTDDATSGGNALFTDVYTESVNLFVSDSAASYQISFAITNSNKTLTATVNKLGTANILTGILGQSAAPNGTVVNLQVWGD